jgi:hypothetical protein
MADGQGIEQISACNARRIDIPQGERRTLLDLTSGRFVLVNYGSSINKLLPTQETQQELTRSSRTLGLKAVGKSCGWHPEITAAGI